MKVNRIIGQYKGQKKGPILVFVAGIHGNETSGILALKKVFKLLDTEKPDINGSIIGLAGNIAAIEREVRYVDKDLNRIWLSEEDDPEVSEYLERKELSNAINEALSSHEDEVYFFDLHSTSSESSPFIMMSDTLRNRQLSEMVGVPMVLGLLEHLMGMFMDATSRSGFPTILFQGGTKGNESTVINHTGLICKSLKHLCGLDTSQIAECEAAIMQLNRYIAKDEDHLFYEIVHSHKIRKDADFDMKSGYTNFKSIRKREVLATENGKEIKAVTSGQIFMPLYQKRGAEGFYIISRIPFFWIKFSMGFRLFRYHDKLHWMLGVKKINDKPLIYRVDEQITFMWAVEIFHLLGYIKVRQDGPFLYMTRREDARNPPSGKEAIKEFATKAYLRSELKNIKSEWKIPFSKAK